MVLDIASIGQVGTWLQTSITAIRNAAAQLQIEPAARINGVDHFSTDDVQRIGNLLKGLAPNQRKRK